MARNSKTPFDILEYWKSQSISLPVMSHITKDVLAIPITSVVAESSFSMGGTVLTKYRSSYVPIMSRHVMPDDVDHDSLPREDA
ncbi:putative AC transposase [Bienertia sinuspersici]